MTPEINRVKLYDPENSITEVAKARDPKTGKSMQSWRWLLFVDRRCYRDTLRNMRVHERGYGISEQDGKVLWVSSIQFSDHFLKKRQNRKKANVAVVRLHVRTKPVQNIM